MKFDHLIIAGGRAPSRQLFNYFHALSLGVVAVDRGYDLLHKLKIKPDLFVGDGDSTTKKPMAKKVVLLPAKKHLSDLEFTIRNLPPKSKKMVLGAHQENEGRSDHAFANLLLALNYKNVFFADSASWVTGLLHQDFQFKTSSSRTFTLVSAAKTKVSVHGAQYNLSSTFLRSPTHGLSNKTLVNKTVKISVRGKALLFVNQSWSKSKIIL